MSSKIELWDHQKKAIAKAKELDGYALFFDPGLGKTLCTIEILRDKFNTAKRIMPTLIVCPIIVVENWKAEWLMFSSMPKDRIVPLVGTLKKRMNRFQGACELYGKQFITIINY